MSEWEIYIIKEIIQEQPKSKLQVQNATQYGDYPFFTSGEKTLSHIDYIIDGENILFATGGVANIKYFSGRCAYSTDTYVFKCTGLYPKFLYYVLLNKIEYINNNLFSGSGLKHLQKKDFHKLKILSPSSIIEQKYIAKILTTTDSVIEKTKAAIAKYKAIKQGMLHDLFTRGIDTKTGKLRSKYEDAPELYKESKLGWIPKEWEDCEMGRYITENLYGPRFNAGDYAENGNVKTIRGTDFTKEGKILYKQAPKALLPKELIKAHKLKNGDVVIVTTADCGLTAIFEQPINDVQFIPSAYSVKYRFSEKVHPYFIKYFMATDSAIRQVNKFVRQGTLGNLPGSDVHRFDMIYPDTDEQIEIANRLESIDNKIQTEQNYLHKLQQIKAGLMADLLSGRKRVMVKKESLTHTEN